jgi:hypothetical protein
MTREEKCKLAIEKGFTYDEVTGKIFGMRGNEINRKICGYINIILRDNKKQYNLYGHQFAYYLKYNKIVKCIDHKDGNRSNNRIDNLREVTHQQNSFNKTKTKGYTFHQNKFKAQIKSNKYIHLGYFNTEQEARQSYLEAKEKYHII